MNEWMTGLHCNITTQNVQRIDRSVIIVLLLLLIMLLLLYYAMRTKTVAKEGFNLIRQTGRQAG